MSSYRHWIEQLDLQPHPEGGWYREVYRAAESISASALPARFAGDRCFCTSIYFLLAGEHFSALHRIKQDELWHFYAGDGLTVHSIDPAGEYRAQRLGAHPERGELFQYMVPAGGWFGANVEPDGYALVGCTVAPGFDFADFEMAERAALIAEFPEHRAIIERLTR